MLHRCVKAAERSRNPIAIRTTVPNMRIESSESFVPVSLPSNPAEGVIRFDAAWFAVEPIDMRAGVDKALARVVDVFGEARAHHAYLFINKRANRMKVLVHDGFGL